jgi:hypothetical protein
MSGLLAVVADMFVDLIPTRNRYVIVGAVMFALVVVTGAVVTLVR